LIKQEIPSVVIFFDYLSNNILTGNATQGCFLMVSKRKRHHKPKPRLYSKPKQLPEN
jgi:hypothetical protein